MKKIDSIRICLCKNLEGHWSWDAALWFHSNTFFADCVVKSAIHDKFPSQKDATVHLERVLKFMGVTKKTKRI